MNNILKFRLHHKKVPVTTRGLGFATQYFFQIIKYYRTSPTNNILYQFYRICLAIFEMKLRYLCQNDVLFINRRMYRKYLDDVKKINIQMPDFIERIINAVGILEVNNIFYEPTININDEMLPQTENILLSNLRQVVEALSKSSTPLEYRKDFYMNNPIPGTIWQGVPENPVLTNADDIISENDNVWDDMDDIRKTFNSLQFVCNFKEIDYNTLPNKAMLLCNDQNGLRICDRVEGEDLNAYCNRIKLEGTVELFDCLEYMTWQEIRDGCLSLLGERPVRTRYSRQNENNNCVRDSSNRCASARYDIETARNSVYFSSFNISNPPRAVPNEQRNVHQQPKRRNNNRRRNNRRWRN